MTRRSLARRWRGATLVALALALTTPPAHAEVAAPADGRVPDGVVTSTEHEPPSGDPPAWVHELGVDDPLAAAQWYLERIRLPAAWEITRGSGDVSIAIIDTGVDPDHQDLIGAFEIDPLTGSSGYDYVNRRFPTYVDPTQDWHGTAVAGVATARAGDGYGMVGVAPNARLRVHRIYASSTHGTPPGQATYATAAAAIRQAAADGADVILLTWGGTTPSAELVNAIIDVDVPVVAAAGNDGQDLSGVPSIRRFPAMYRLPNLVTVAASDEHNALLGNERMASNYGVHHVQIAAPGANIVSLAAGGEHQLFEGTSFAAPQVAAALALGRSVAPGASAAELISALVRTARRSAALSDKVTSGGVLDVVAFLRALERPRCTTDMPPAFYTDVDRAGAHVESIDCVVWWGVSQGLDDERFGPGGLVTRGQLASFLARLLQMSGVVVPEELPSAFTDTVGTTHEREIDMLAHLGVVSGTADGTFGPREPVTRGQMASLVVRTVHTLVARGTDGERDWFDDVAGTAHEESILDARELGITLGTAEPRIYEPSQPLTRAQMATFLARTMDALGREGVQLQRR